MMAYHQDIRTYFGCVLRRALAVWASLARFNPLSTSIHIQILQNDLNAFLNQGSKLKKSSGRLLATNWRNIVARCKFSVASLYNVNDAAHSQGF